jgi:hypothetical protein
MYAWPGGEVKLMATYLSTEGEIEVWILEYVDRKPLMLRVLVPQSPLLRIRELARAKNMPELNGWHRVRQAEGEEISFYAKLHPELQMKDMRFERREK